jgi:hypothetical protein
MKAARWLAALLLLLSIGLLVAHSLRFNFVTDDAFISFVYARNLARHGELVFNLGERVEGYTNFLWTLLMALGIVLRVPPEISSRVLGMLCGALGLVVTSLALRRLRGGPLRPADMLPALLLAAMPGYACWSSGGLETQLFTLLVTVGATEYLIERERRYGLLFGLAALTRPEGILFFGLTVLFHQLSLLRRGARAVLWPRAAVWRQVGLFCLLVVPHLLFRRLYYGYWVPNTFYIKSSAGTAAFQQGAYYLLQFARESHLYVLLAFGLVLLRTPRLRPVLLYTLMCTGVFLLYVASVGGDFMGLHRFVMPIVPLNVLCGALGLYELFSAARLAAAARATGVLLLLGLHGLNTYAVDRRALSFIGADRGIDTPGYLRHYTADRIAIGRWLGQHVQPDDYQVVGGAGAQVYYAGIRALDSFGLSDAYIAHHVPAISTRPGHEKFAPLSYVLSKNPTIITYNVYRIADEPYRPDYAEAAAWRQRGFHYVSVQILGLSRPWYSFLKRIDRRLGPLPPADLLDP